LSKQQHGRQPERPQGSAAEDSSKAAEKTGLLRFFREMGSALVMALIAIVYVIQAFQIPSGSMEDSLLVGDFLLGLKFIYGAPLLPYSREIGITRRLPAVAKPKRGDVIIFKYPGADAKDYIKRMVAGPGDTVRFIGNRRLLVNGVELTLPPHGKYSAREDARIAGFAPLRIPAKGDVLCPDTMPIREFLFLKTLIRQENPTKRVYMHFDIYVDGEAANNVALNNFTSLNGKKCSLNDLHDGNYVYAVKVENRRSNETTRRLMTFDFNRIDNWTDLDHILDGIRQSFPSDKSVVIRKKLYIGNERVENYTVRNDNYFMAGDNRDNSLDSRYWGYLNYNFVKAKALILYFSYDNSGPAWKFPANIRWNRIGKLIRTWDGESERNPKIKY
jgi:signal peptidase I